MRKIVVRTAVVGSGCAGLNAADWLAALGEEVLLITEDMNSGTSRNTGSDKQTYYKLSLAGDEGDSIGELAETLAAPDVDGDIALCEAAGSARSFFKLVQLGVPFPCNEMGEYVGYQTDHDTRRRATSAGPLTSRYMTEELERSVRGRNIPILNHTLIFRILTDQNGVCGLLGLDTHTRELTAVRCAHVILATGGAAGVYADRVYPESQFGMSGMAFAAGCRGANLHCWQYGLASVAFRWNVSGSYQQVIPRYVSVDRDGKETDFLSSSLTAEDQLNFIFLKGYQWPFDPKRVNGSSRVDMLVKAETDHGRRVYMDFRRNPAAFSFERLGGEARDYLTRCGAVQQTPIERLRTMNSPAIELYRAHGIDLERDLLEVRVCAQHHNGGIGVDCHWQTDVPGLYACGEAAGTFGQSRPGGAALNSTQVGSMRAAQDIARSRRTIPERLPPIGDITLPAGEARKMTEELQKEMTRCAAFMRDAEGIRAMRKRLDELIRHRVPLDKNDDELDARIRLQDMMTVQMYILDAMLFDLEQPGTGILETDGRGTRRRQARPIPERELWFERVWRANREREEKHREQ